MAHNLLEILEKKVLVSMGATGTNLVSLGLDMGGCIAEWELNHPREVEGLIKEFLDAGSDVIEVGSAPANRFRLQPYGFQSRAAEWNFELARLWREATPPGRFLIASLGITSRILEPAGDATFDEIYESYCEQVVNLAKGGVEGFWALTMTDTREAGAAIQAVKDCTHLPVIASMVFDSNRRGFFTMMGIDPRTAAKDLEAWGADAVGTNCGGTAFRLGNTTRILEEMRSASSRCLVAKPNAGNPKETEGKVVYDVTPEEMAAEALEWVSAGARIVGGCCGTTPEHIARIAEAVRRH
jgi:5-methyltetrahydrofolate--homocysteine methyltransferase